MCFVQEQEHLDIILASCWDYATRLFLKRTRNPFIKFTTHTSWWLHNDSTTLSINLWDDAMQQMVQQHASLLFPRAVCDRGRHAVFNGPVCDRRAAEWKPGERDSSVVKLQHVSLHLASHPVPLRKHRVVKTASRACHLLEVSPLNHRWHSCMSKAVPEPSMDGDHASFAHIWTLFVLALGPQSHATLISFKNQLAELLLTAVRLRFYTQRGLDAVSKF